MPSIHQHGPGGGTTIEIGAEASVTTGTQGDARITDQEGNVLADSKNERIVAADRMLDAIAPKVVCSPLLRGILQSHSKSVSDRANELVHLYEVREAIAKHYGGESPARAALGISGSEWSRLGRLANDEPLNQGRHRGAHVGALRDATTEELEEARSIVRKWIDAVADKT